MTLDGRELRDGLAADYKRSAARMGADVSFTDAQRLATSDLILVDAHNSTLKPKPTHKQRKEARRLERAKKMAEKAKLAVSCRDIPAIEKADASALVYKDGKPVLDARKLGEMKHAKLLERMAQLAQVAAKENGRHEHAFPLYAREMMGEQFDMTIGRGKYLGKNKADTDRIFYRFMLDLADRSTGILGPWWVK